MAFDDPLKRARVAVCTAFFANGAIVGGLAPHIPGRSFSLHLNTGQLGTALFAAGLGAVCGMPLANALVSWCGSRQTTMIAGQLLTIIFSGVILAPTPTIFGVALFAFGLSGATMDVAMNSQAIAVEERLGERNMSRFHGLFSAGGAAGSAVSSALLARHIRDGYAAVILSGALLALQVYFLRWMLPKSETDQRAEIKRARLRGTLLLLGALAVAAMVSEGAVGDWSALFLRTERHVGEGLAGYGYTAFAVAMLVGRFSGDRMMEFIREERTLRIGAAVAAFGYVVVLISHNAGACIAGFAMVGVGLANASPILYRAAGKVPGVAPQAGIATAVGTGYAGLLAGPPALGWLARSVGLGQSFIALIVLCSLLMLVAGRVSQLSTSSGATDSF
jgi:fucose permease